MYSKRNKKIKRLKIKAFNMIAKKIEAKTMTKRDCICKFKSTTCDSNQKWNNKTCQCDCKYYHKCKKDYIWNPSTDICKNGKYLKSIANFSVIEWNEILSVLDTISTKMTITIANNVTKNCYSKIISHKIDWCFFAYSFISNHITNFE